MHAKGICMCGKSSYKLDGEPSLIALCHCLNCRKLTSSLYSHCLLLPASSLTFSPTSPLNTATIPHHEAGFAMTVTFCGECGSALAKVVDEDALRGQVIVFAGCLDWDEDGGLEDLKPQAEMWVKYRAGWVGEVSGEGVKQCAGFFE